MIRIGQREFAIPLWLWAAVPLGFVLYSCIDLGLTSRSRLIVNIRFFQQPDRLFLAMIAQLAIAALTGFLLVDLARRSRTPWYGLPLLWLASAAAALCVVSDVVSRSLEGAARIAVGLAMSAVGAPRGSGGVGVLHVAMLAVPVLLAILAALLVTIASRLVAGFPLLTRDTRREYWGNLFGAGVWLLIALGGYVTIRSAYGLALGRPAEMVPQWLPLAAASSGAMAATALYLYFTHRSRRRQTTAVHDLRVWLLAGLCVVSSLYRPELLGIVGVGASYSYVRPALRAVHLLATPALEVAGYKVTVAYEELRTMLGSAQPDGGRAYIAFPLPADYGLTTKSHAPYLNIVRRNAPLTQVASYWAESRRELDALQATNPGRDAVVRLPRPAALVLRLNAYPELDFYLSSFDPAASSEAVEQALRRFLRDRLRRTN